MLLLTMMMLMIFKAHQLSFLVLLFINIFCLRGKLTTMTNVCKYYETYTSTDVFAVVIW